LTATVKLTTADSSLAGICEFLLLQLIHHADKEFHISTVLSLKQNFIISSLNLFSNVVITIHSFPLLLPSSDLKNELID